MDIFRCVVLVAVLRETFSHPIHHNGSAIGDILGVNQGHGGASDLMEIDIKRRPGHVQSTDVLNGLSVTAKKWPNGVLHFTISNEFGSSQKTLIRDALKEIERNTCIKFVEYALGNAPTDHVAVSSDSGCWSYVGMIGGKQTISLANGCVYTGTVIHEFLHALGVYHEQSRKDRDNYVGINWSNIQAGLSSNFDIENTNSMGVEYDPKSVMHYSNYAFSNNGQMTIYLKNDPTFSLGGRELTQLDIKQLNLFYGCNNPVTTKSTSTTKFTTKSTLSTTSSTRSTSTTTFSPPVGTCGDKSFTCVRAHFRPGRYCQDSYYRDNCPQTCNQCDGGNVIQCVNFKDTENYDCGRKQQEGRCTSKDYSTRFDMKTYCTMSCCLEGTLYG